MNGLIILLISFKILKLFQVEKLGEGFIRSSSISYLFCGQKRGENTRISFFTERKKEKN